MFIAIAIQPKGPAPAERNVRNQPTNMSLLGSWRFGLAGSVYKYSAPTELAKYSDHSELASGSRLGRVSLRGDFVSPTFLLPGIHFPL